MRLRGSLLIAAFALAVAASCAFEDGLPFGEADFDVKAAFDPADRADAGGLVRTSKNYSVRVDQLTLDAGAVTLSMIPSGGETVDFDPADPPPGYTLCHNGHCHREDGALVSYDDVIAELAGEAGEGGFTLVRSAVAAIDLDADPAPVPLDDCPNDCELSEGTLSSLEVALAALSFTGHVFDQLTGDRARLPEAGVAVRFDAALTQTLLDLVAGKIEEGKKIGVRFDVDVVLPGALFDGIDWETELTGRNLTATVDLTASETIPAALDEAIGEHAEFSVDKSRYNP